jgi:hypothetical protein
MAEDDIYKNKARYERLISNFENVKNKPKRGKYYCKNNTNVKYFKDLCKSFDAKDLSYARRTRALDSLKLITYFLDKDLKECNRDDIDYLMSRMHKTYKTVSSKKSFIKDLKAIWRVLFPEKDHLGRVDETICPYVVRHISRRIDKSKEKRRNEKYTIEEFEKIIRFFDGNPS